MENPFNLPDLQTTLEGTVTFLSGAGGWIINTIPSLCNNSCINKQKLNGSVAAMFTNTHGVININVNEIGAQYFLIKHHCERDIMIDKPTFRLTWTSSFLIYRRLTWRCFVATRNFSVDFVSNFYHCNRFHSSIEWKNFYLNLFDSSRMICLRSFYRSEWRNCLVDSPWFSNIQMPITSWDTFCT